MAKKTFLGNPALQFLSSASPAEREDSVPARPESPAAPPAGYRDDPRYVETKTRRLQLVLQPSLYERVRACAAAQGLSVNEYVHRALERATNAPMSEKCD